MEPRSLGNNQSTFPSTDGNDTDSRKWISRWMRMEASMRGRTNWLQIIVAALITGIVAIGATLIGTAIQSKEPGLNYVVNAASSFAGKEQYFAIYNISITNPGKVKVDEVVGVFVIGEATIEDFRVIAHPATSYTSEISAGTLKLYINELNPSEIVGVSIFVVSDNKPPDTPEVYVRGAGINGIEATSITTEGEDSALSNIWLTILAAYAGLIAGLYFMIPRHLISLYLFGRHSANQNEILAYLCGIHGLTSQVDYYLNKTEKASYWSESDRLASIAIINPKSEQANKMQQVLIDLLAYAHVNRYSKGIVNYNIARIAFAKDDIAHTKNYLDEAIKYHRKLVEIRLQLQPGLQKLLEISSGENPGREKRH